MWLPWICPQSIGDTIGVDLILDTVPLFGRCRRTSSTRVFKNKLTHRSSSVKSTSVPPNRGTGTSTKYLPVGSIRAACVVRLSQLAELVDRRVVENLSQHIHQMTGHEKNTSVAHFQRGVELRPEAGRQERQEASCVRRKGPKRTVTRLRGHPGILQVRRGMMPPLMISTAILYDDTFMMRWQTYETKHRLHTGSLNREQRGSPIEMHDWPV